MSGGRFVMHYFAYGSNLDPDQMRRRCPGSEFVCNAMLVDYRLAFTSWSPRRACGVADVVPAAGEVVWGAVYRMSESDWPPLDQAEGYSPGRDRNSYQRTRHTVYRNGDREAPMTCWLYEVCDKSDSPICCNDEYKGLILRGARHWNLPADYIEHLERIETG